MILALIASLAATCVTGYMMTTDAYWGAEWVEDVHAVFANLTVGLVVLHVLGVLVASFDLDPQDRALPPLPTISLSGDSAQDEPHPATILARVG
jgi:Prokaryotic cytochrome b561